MPDSITRNGVAWNLDESPYRYNVDYDELSITFVFSSEFYKQNFITKYLEHRIKINDSLSNRFGFRVVNDVLSDIRLYSRIEKRGFLLYKNGDKFGCLKSIKLDGKNPIMTI